MGRKWRKRREGAWVLTNYYLYNLRDGRGNGGYHKDGWTMDELCTTLERQKAVDRLSNSFNIRMGRLWDLETTITRDAFSTLIAGRITCCGEVDTFFLIPDQLQIWRCNR